MSSISYPQPIYLHDTLPFKYPDHISNQMSRRNASSYVNQVTAVSHPKLTSYFGVIDILPSAHYLHDTLPSAHLSMSYHTNLSKWYPALATSIYTIPHRPVSHPPLTSYFDVIDTRLQII